jgi:carboxymethylenebutenolidase
LIEHHLDLPTADGAMNTFVVAPDEDGPFPLVLFYMDAPGKREELHDMARRLAAVGYCVILPNLYYRVTRDLWLKDRSEATMAEMFAYTDTLNRHTTEVDTAAMLACVDQLPQADASRIGALGYCMSGPFVVWAAATFPDQLRCIASIYGANMATEQPDSPHRVAEQRIRNSIVPQRACRPGTLNQSKFTLGKASFAWLRRLARRQHQLLTLTQAESC